MSDSQTRAGAGDSIGVLTVATPIPLHLTVDPWWGYIACLAYGVCDDGVDPERREGVAGEAVELMFAADGQLLGFRAGIDVEPSELADDVLWDGPRFTVPVLGLEGASIGEILLAVRARFGSDGATVDAVHLHAAIGAEAEDALEYFTVALQSGEMKAHFGLGYTLVELRRAAEAYSHLRRYTELVPLNAWGWCWLGRACADMGEIEEARRAFAEAIRLEADLGAFETDAAEQLAELG